MFRNLIPQLADRYHVIAPDYPGFGQSDAPAVDKFAYSFDNLAQVVDKFTTVVGASKFALYVQDYGAPIGFRVAAAHPERVSAIVVQNGNAYNESIDNEFPAAGAAPYLRDLPKAELHLLDTGHFALEEDGEQIGKLMRTFLAHNVK